MKAKKGIIVLRVVSVVLLLITAATIFVFSSQNVKKSVKTSRAVTEKICENVVSDYAVKDSGEQKKIVKSNDNSVRKAAHMALFFAFGAFAFLSIISYRNIKLYIRIGLSFLVSVLYAASDEIHQIFVAGRGPQITDVLVDISGAAAAIILLCIVFRLMKVRKPAGMED